MYQIDMNPARTLELAVEGTIREQQGELSDLPDEELTELMVQGKREYHKWEGVGPAWAWMEVVDQSEEVYKGMAAGRILADRYGKNYVKDLLKEAEERNSNEC